MKTPACRSKDKFGKDYVALCGCDFSKWRRPEVLGPCGMGIPQQLNSSAVEIYYLDVSKQNFISCNIYCGFLGADAGKFKELLVWIPGCMAKLRESTGAPGPTTQLLALQILTLHPKTQP